MNIFYLHPDSKIAAQMHCDKHVVKMLLETSQLLCTAHRELDDSSFADEAGLYKVAHKNHPSAKWVRESRENYRWTHSLLVALCEEYTLRYNKTHKTQKLGIVGSLHRCPDNLPTGDFTAPPQCMPEEYKCEHPVDAYRKYYLGEKMRFAVWKFTEAPNWVTA